MRKDVLEGRAKGRDESELGRCRKMCDIGTRKGEGEIVTRYTPPRS